MTISSTARVICARYHDETGRCAQMGGMTPVPRGQRAGSSGSRRTFRPSSNLKPRFTTMSAVSNTPYVPKADLRRRPKRQFETVELTGRRPVRVEVPAGTSVMRAALWKRHLDIPKLCATDTTGAVRLLPGLPGRDRGTPGHTRLVHRPVEAGHGGPHSVPRNWSPDIRKGVHGALHVRPSIGLPDLCESTATANCRTWPARSDCARSAMPTAPSHLDAENRRDSNPYFQFDRIEVHRLLALRPRLRRSARAPSR